MVGKWLASCLKVVGKLLESILRWVVGCTLVGKQLAGGCQVVGKYCSQVLEKSCSVVSK
jgi:hypothetical protein